MQCVHCKTTEGPFIKNNQTEEYTYYWCNPCNTARIKKYRHTKKGAAATYAAVRSQYAKAPYKQIARIALFHAIQIGKIIRPEECSVCHKKIKVEGHHPDYSKPLEVIWMCRRCHFDLHKKLRCEIIK